MTPEQIKKEDIELFYLKDCILSQVDEYNIRLKKLEKVRPSQFASMSPSKFDSGCEGVMGLAVKQVLLDKIMI